MKKKKDNRFDDIDGKSALVIPMTLLRHPNMVNLSAFGHKLIHDLGTQYTGFNNGYLCASRTVMEPLGWRSTFTLHKTVLELEHYGLIVRTQQGGLNKANLHAFTWRRIDEKVGHPLMIAPTPTASNAWKEPRVKFVYEKPTRGQSHRSNRLKRAA